MTVVALLCVAGLVLTLIVWMDYRAGTHAPREAPAPGPPPARRRELPESSRALPARLRAIARVLDAPLFRNSQTDSLAWYAQPYINTRPERWIAEARDTLLEAARVLAEAPQEEQKSDHAT